MPKTVHLNGGPWHDRVVALQDGGNHFHIVSPAPPRFIYGQIGPAQEIGRREGMYSQVTGYPGEFEWDGWGDHGC